MAERRFYLRLITAGGAAILIGCGGSSNNSGEHVDTGIPVASNTVEAVNTPDYGLIDSTVEPTLSSENTEVPQDAIAILNNIDVRTNLTDEQVDALRAQFEKEWRAAGSDEYMKYGAYYDLRSSLVANSKTNEDSGVSIMIDEIEILMASNPSWETFYRASSEDGAFLDN